MRVRSILCFVTMMLCKNSAKRLVIRAGIFVIVALRIFLTVSSVEGIGYRLQFSQNGDRFDWSHSLTGWSYSTSRITLSGSTRLHSALTKASRGSRQGDRWRDDSNANWSLSYSFSQKARLGLSANMNRSSDNFSRFKEPIITQSVSSSLSYTPFTSGPFKSLSFSQSTGQSFDRRLNQRDSGISYTFGTSVRPELLDGMSSSFSYSKSGNTLRRSDLNASLRGGLGYKIAEGIRTDMTFSESRRERKYWRTKVGLNDPVLEERFTRSRSVNSSFNIKPNDDFDLTNSFSYSNNLNTDTASDGDRQGFEVADDVEILDEDGYPVGLGELREGLRVVMELEGQDDVALAVRIEVIEEGRPFPPLRPKEEVAGVIKEEVAGVIEYVDEIDGIIFLIVFDSRNPKMGTDRQGISFSWNSDLSLRLFDRLDFSYGISYRANDLSYLPNNIRFKRYDLDRSSEDVSMKSSLNFKIDEGHSVALSGFVGRVSNDTPSEEEFNDRDEFKSRLRATYSGEFKGGLRLSLSGSTDQNHLVNLKAQKSSNNKWNRNYALNASTSYDLFEGMKVSQSYGVSTNYTSFDYDELLNPDDPKSDVYRSWSMNNSVNMAVSRRMKLRAGYSYEAGDRGSYFQNAGEQLVTEDEKRHSANFGVSYDPVEWLSISSGYRYQVRRKWKHSYNEEGETRKLAYESEFDTFSMNISYNPSDKNKLSLNGSRTKRESMGRRLRTQNFITVSYSHTF